MVERVINCSIGKGKSGWPESNRRPLAPQASTLNHLRYSPILYSQGTTGAI